MAKLHDCYVAVQKRLESLAWLNSQYRDVRQVLDGLADGKVAENFQLKLVVNDEVQIGLPLPKATEELRGPLEEAGNGFAAEIVQTWRELHAAAAEAVAHCDEAEQRAAGATPPAAPAAVIPSGAP